jgi:hypothetical protein
LESVGVVAEGEAGGQAELGGELEEDREWRHDRSDGRAEIDVQGLEVDLVERVLEQRHVVVGKEGLEG